MKESEIQSQIMDMLKKHPRVVWSMVTTTGKAQIAGYWVTLGFEGLSDILGQVETATGSTTLAIEVKRPGEQPTKAQHLFLDKVKMAGGISGWCDSLKGAMDILEAV